MDLFIYSTGVGSLSNDPDCILVLAYIRLGKCPMNIHIAVPKEIYSRDLPLLLHGNQKHRGVSNILTYLRKENYGLEYELSDLEAVQLCALISAVERRLIPAIDWFLWADDLIYSNFTKGLYFNSLKFIRHFYLPHQWRNEKINRARNSQLIFSFKSSSDDQIGDQLFKIANLCITSLSYILGDQTYFVANRPTAVDAYVFAYLWPLFLYESQMGTLDWMNLDTHPKDCRRIASHPLITHVLQCPNLVRHFKHILTCYFQEFVVIFRKEAPTGESLILSHPIRDFILWGCGVAGLFLSFAHYSGNLNLSRITSN